MPLVARVQESAERHRLWTPTTRIVAGVSGGSDSVALLFVLRELADAGALVLAGLAHLHHHVRGEEADADAAFCAALAARLGIPSDLGHADVPALARSRRESIELAARHARLAFFEQTRGRLGADLVALAHTRRDQAETVLLRLIRGAGPRGLGAMAPRNGFRIRPLLNIGHDDLRRWLADRGELWREDSSNRDVRIARNRLRAEVMPALTQINPRAEEAIARAARIQTADADYLDEMAAAAVERLVQVTDKGLTIDAEELGRMPEAVSRRILLRMCETLDPFRAYGWEETDAVLEACRNGRSRDLPGLRLERTARFAVLSKRGFRRASPSPAGATELPLSVPGTARDTAGRWMIEANGPMPAADAPPPAAARAVLDAQALGRQLTIRGWRPGDRVQPLGLAGRKKLQDLFVDRKIPRDERNQVPIVTDALDRIAWVAGHVVGEPFRVTPSSEAVVVLILRR